MIPHWWTACATRAALNPRPARSGPKAPSPALPWQLRHAVARGACLSQYAFPAAALPRGVSRSPALDEREGKQCKSWLFHGSSPRE
jgi:hypothetical protein